MKIVEIFEKIPDFRTKSLVRYRLSELLVISLCAVLSGADDFEEISSYGKEKEDFLRQFLELKGGIPSHDTFRRVFAQMDVKSFENCLVEHSQAIVDGLRSNYQIDIEQINIDGKVLRATGERGKKTAAICIVSAWLSDYNLSLGQSKVSKKSNEKTAIPKIVKSVDVQERLVSIDAMGCDKKTAALITSEGGYYLLALKENQKGLYEEVHDWMQQHKSIFDSIEQVDLVGGRIEKRTTYVCKDLTFIDEAKNWEGSKVVIMVETQRDFKHGVRKSKTHTRFYISSLQREAAFFAERIRSHWSIENQLHWHLDVVFLEDKQRLKSGNAPENMSILRKLALQILKQHKGKKSLKTTRKKVAWNQNFLKNILLDFLTTYSCV